MAREFEAVSAPVLRESLEEQGFYVFDIHKKQWWKSIGNSFGGGGRPSGRDFLTFNQELLVLLRSGLPILQVLDAVTERMEPGLFREALRDIREEIRGGAILSESFNKHSHLFPHLYIASIKAGEKSGDLPVTLGRFIVYQKRVEAIRAKVKSAIFYPILLSLAVVTVVLFLLFYVIPSFSQIYSDANAVLPLATRILITLSNFLISALPLLVPLSIALIFVLKAYLRSENGIRWKDRLFLRLPYLGKLVIDYAILGFCRTFGTTLLSGIPIVQAMSMARGTLNNRLLEDKMSIAIRRIEEGASISQAISEGNFFPGLALRMIGVGESTGALAEMLWDIADYYESEVERRLDRLTTMVEPLMMMMMAIVIGGIVIAMYIPIFQLAGTVR
ncbi:MAG: type II secretion system F family protein [Desulfuromonadales bacterium]|nr:type II secretion system F family protein [Desulfuromonadales bacterium]